MSIYENFLMLISRSGQFAPALDKAKGRLGLSAAYLSYFDCAASRFLACGVALFFPRKHDPLSRTNHARAG
jgi:hypothetical protein